ncbi:AMP deaminase-like, partial [Pistacia vera]|uniref:AMP deaminase-like n=1 Tax=Pistacia vera TaxID=55513 RepID=UPI00126320CE
MDSSSSASSLHLAMAALVGASLMAISAFFIHKRSVDQVLDRLIEIRRELPQNRDGHFYEEENEEEEYSEGGYDSDGDGMTRQQNRESRSLEDSMLRRYKNTMSSSLPNVSVRNDWLEEDAKFDEAIRVRAQNCSASSLDKLNFIPSGLPPLQTSHRLGEDQPFNRGGSSARLASVGILRTPRSPGGSGFENAEDSEDDGTELANEDDMDYSYEDIDSSANFMNDVDSKIQNSSAVPFRTDLVNFVQDQNCRASINVVKPGIDVHGRGKVDTASAQITGHDTTLPNVILPLRTTLHESTTIEDEEVRKMLQECLDLRKSYVYTEEVAPWLKEAVPEPYASEVKIDPFHFEPVEASTHHFRMEDGVVHVYASENDTVDLFPVANSTTFFTDMHHILRIMSIGNVRSACHHRLRFLEEKFRLHLLVKADKEFLAQKGAPHRDFYNIRKVDTHVHHSACMNQKHLLRFIKSKLRKEPDEVVIFRDGKYMTLKEVFESLDLSGYDLNVDLLDVHADKSTFHRFDKFNLKYNPCGQSRLREIFLKQDNLIQ